ncbi:MAG TPA: radical SAM protein, partial [Methanoregula sp.]|nr:radical SAM protein [Methanoregula sp.]
MDIRYDQVCFPRTNLSSEQVRNYLVSRIHSRLRIRTPGSYPIALQLEPTVRCQLSCPLCPRLRMQSGPAGDDLHYENYLKLMDEVGPSLLAIAFWQWGEPLLHPRISDMVALAHQKNILTIISTNGQVSPDEFDIQKLFDAGLDMLIISLDGISQDAYDSFRRDGEASRTMQFAEAACRIKRTTNRSTPLINIRIIATSETEGEIAAVREFSRKIGADIFSVKAVSLYYEDDPESPILPSNREYRSFQYKGAVEAARYKQMIPACNKPWSWPTLLHDGTLLICECDHQSAETLGNVFATGFGDVWAGSRSADIRARFPDLEFCRRCRYKV